MEIYYDVKIPPKKIEGKGKERSKEYIKIKDFIKSDHETMKFVYKGQKEASRRRQSLSVTIRRESLPIKLMVRGNELYVINIEKVVS